jgi:hypothetical protein
MMLDELGWRQASRARYAGAASGDGILPTTTTRVEHALATPFTMTISDDSHDEAERMV